MHSLFLKQNNDFGAISAPPVSLKHFVCCCFSCICVFTHSTPVRTAGQGFMEGVNPSLRRLGLVLGLGLATSVSPVAERVGWIGQHGQTHRYGIKFILEFSSLEPIPHELYGLITLNLLGIRTSIWFHLQIMMFVPLIAGLPI